MLGSKLPLFSYGSDGHQHVINLTVGVYITIIRISYWRWDEFIPNIRSWSTRPQYRLWLHRCFWYFHPPEGDDSIWTTFPLIAFFPQVGFANRRRGHGLGGKVEEVYNLSPWGSLKSKWSCRFQASSISAIDMDFQGGFSSTSKGVFWKVNFCFFRFLGWWNSFDFFVGIFAKVKEGEKQHPP